MNAPERVPDAIQKLRDGKRALRAERRGASLPEKVRQVVKLQRVVLVTLKRQRNLRPWERVWFED